MARLEDRIKRLEQREQTCERGYSNASPEMRRRIMDRLYALHENARRERAGEPLIPEPPETLEDVLHELDKLESYAARPGYQRSDDPDFIEHWRKSVAERLERLK